MAVNKMTEATFWDGRYGEDGFAYGKEPNVYIRECAGKYLTPSEEKPVEIVELASGEGRNVAYLASLKHKVLAVDFSQTGLDKTLALAEGMGCKNLVEVFCADTTTWQPPNGPATMDAVVMSFCHVPLDKKSAFFKNMVAMLKPGGYLFLECFHPNQLHKGYKKTSGGPTDVNMVYTVVELRELLQGTGCAGKELEADELEYVLHEGKYHEGLGALTRFVWQKE